MPKVKNDAGRATLKETSKKERGMRIGKDKQNPNQTAGLNPNRSITELTVNMLKAFIFKSNIIRPASYTIYFISWDIGKLTHNAKYTTTEFVLVPKEKKTERQNLSTERDRDLCQYMTY